MVKRSALRSSRFAIAFLCGEYDSMEAIATLQARIFPNMRSLSRVKLSADRLSISVDAIALLQASNQD